LREVREYSIIKPLIVINSLFCFGCPLYFQFRDAQVRLEELETANDFLQKRIEKMKNNRLAVINS